MHNKNLTYISFLLVLLSAKVFAQAAQTINVLVDMPDVINKERYENAYKQMEQDYLNQRQDPNTELKFVMAEEPANKDTVEGYEHYVEYILKKLEDSSVDMLILDNTFLYSETATIESRTLNQNFKNRQFHRKYEDISKYSQYDKSQLSIYDPEINEDCYYDNGLYALPYEIDYDVLYYKNNGTSIISSIDTNNNSWESLLDVEYMKNGEKKSLSIPLKEEEELLKFFTEYISSLPNFKDFGALYDEKDTSIIDNFKIFVTKSESLNLGLKEAFDSFINGESVFFKGKASHYGSLKQVNNTITPLLLPQNKSVLLKKYIVINKNSKIDKNTLVSVASQLTSTDMQAKRYTSYQMLPPAINKLQKNDYPELLNLYNKMEKVNIKNVYKDEKSAPFMEIKLYLPQMLKEFLNNSGDHKKIQNVFENIRKILKEKRGIHQMPLYIIYIPAILFTIIAIVTIYLILKYKEHPTLKIYSPNFCIIMIIGMVLSIIDVCVIFNNEKVSFCKINYVIETIYTDLTLFPMVAVTYRIYKILTNNSNVSVDRNLNSRIVIFFIVGMTLMICYSSFTAFRVLDFFLSSEGTIKTFRQPICDYSSDLFLLESVERRINEAIYLFLVYMVVRTARVSKKFGEFKYVYIMFFTGIFEYTRSYFISIIPQGSYYYFYVAVISISILLDGLLIYFLIGSRLIYVIKHPEEMKKKKNKYEESTSYYNTYNGGQETTTNNDGLHSHFIDISKTGNTSYGYNKHIPLNSTDFDCYSNKGYVGTNNYDKNYLSSNSTPINDYYNINSSGAYLLNNQDTFSSQKTVGQDSRNQYINLLSSNGTSSLTPNISIEDDYPKSRK